MKLDEAIKHCEEVYKNKKDDAEEARLQEQDQYANECMKCALEHRQLAEWLWELRRRRRMNDVATRSSAQPEHIKGKWIDNTYCSECGWANQVEPGFVGSVEGFNFCPNCGADMNSD